MGFENSLPPFVCNWKDNLSVKLSTSVAGDCPLYKVLVRAVSDLQYTAVFSQT